MKHLTMGACALFAWGCATTAPEASPAPIDASSASHSDLPVTLKGLRYIAVSVADIDAALAFYAAGVDYEVTSRAVIDRDTFDPALLSQVAEGDASGPVEVALLKLTNTYLKLMDFDLSSDAVGAPLPVPGPGYTHMCIISPATASVFPKLRAAGMTMVTRGQEPVDLGGYGMLYAYGRDPSGAMIETEVASFPRRDDPYWVGHVANVTPDLDRMIAFYAELIGYPERRRGELANNPLADQIAGLDDMVLKGGWFALRNIELEFWQFESPATPEPTGRATLDTMGYSAIAFEVDDLDNEIARLTAAGVTFAAPPRMEAGWRVAYAYDPDGKLFSLQQNVSADPDQSIDDLLWIDPATF